jgi:hypothetical protein
MSFMHTYSFLSSLSNVFISLLCINHKSMNVTGYTRSSSKVCVCMFTQMGKDRFLFLFVYTSPNNRRRLLLERRATLLKYLILQYINRVSKKERENWTTFSRPTIIVKRTRDSRSIMHCNDCCSL